MLTIFIRGMLCNWMVSLGVVGAMVSTTVSGKGYRDVDANLLRDGVRALSG